VKVAVVRSISATTLLIVAAVGIGNAENSTLPEQSRHGQELERGGLAFHLYSLSGVKFIVPISHRTARADPYPQRGFDINLMWPDIPPGRAPEAKFKQSQLSGSKNKVSNKVTVQVRERPKGVSDVDPYERLRDDNYWISGKNIEQTDSALQLRLYRSKSTPNIISYAYSLSERARTPLRRVPVVIMAGEYISFVYAPNIHVRIIMDWESSSINPDWERIYVAVVALLDQYRKDGVNR
jgi:hypothetical protein